MRQLYWFAMKRWPPVGVVFVHLLLAGGIASFQSWPTKRAFFDKCCGTPACQICTPVWSCPTIAYSAVTGMRAHCWNWLSELTERTCLLWMQIARVQTQSCAALLTVVKYNDDCVLYIPYAQSLLYFFTSRSAASPLISCAPPPRQKPWFKNFRGEILEASPQHYIMSGEISVLSPTQVEITELPVKTWTQPYKEFLSQLLNPEKGTPMISWVKPAHVAGVRPRFRLAPHTPWSRGPFSGRGIRGVPCRGGGVVTVSRPNKRRIIGLYLEQIKKSKVIFIIRWAFGNKPSSKQQNVNAKFI